MDDVRYMTRYSDVMPLISLHAQDVTLMSCVGYRPDLQQKDHEHRKTFKRQISKYCPDLQKTYLRHREDVQKKRPRQRPDVQKKDDQIIMDEFCGLHLPTCH